MKQQFHTKYRPDIDGLRALSVLTIMVFHLNQNWIPGGFVAIEVFFVISGYLITSIIKKQFDTNQFSFKEFYTRRIKRILPLFFTMVFVVLIAAAIILRPWDDYGSFWKTTRYAMQFRANQAFINIDYFGAASDEKPLMHLWTLAIEAQFYFFWPITLFFLYKLFKKREKYLHWLFFSTIILILASTLTGLYAIYIQHENAYFLLRARGTGLLVGCTLALNPYTIDAKYKTPLGILGLILIFACYAIYTPELQYPGFYALIPSIGAALFILDSNVSRYKWLFTNTLIRTIGLWSFSIYLWHWPILAFIRYIRMDIDLPLFWMVFAYSLTFILSFITYYCVEDTVRKVKLNFHRSLILIYLVPCIILFSMNSFFRSDLYKSHFSPMTDQSEITRWFSEQELPCNNKILDNCTVTGDLSANTKLLLVGDSHAAHLAITLDIIGKKEHWKADIISANGCPVFFNYHEPNEYLKLPECVAVNDYLENNWQQYDAILLSQFYASEYTQFTEQGDIGKSSLLENLLETVQTIAAEKPVYLFSDTPSSNKDLLRLELFKQKDFDQWISIDDFTINPHYLVTNQYLQAVAKMVDNVHYVDIAKYIPETLKLNGQPLYLDKDHLNPYGSTEVGKLFIKDQVILQQ